MSRRDATTTKVFVGSLPPGVTTDDLRRLFTPYGKIVECDIANRCGFLHLEDRDLAMKAIQELNNTTFMGGRISVEKGRVKPPRNRNRDGGPMRGGRGGPYARDDAYGGRGPPRNGMGGYGDRNAAPVAYGGGYGERFDYDRGAPRAFGEYDAMGDRRQMYDDRRGGYMDDRRGYAPPNGYDRAYDERAAYPDARGGYDDRQMGAAAAVPDPYDDRRMMGDRRPMMDQNAARSAVGGGYDRSGAGSDMYSRRGDLGPKPGLAAPAGGYSERDASYGGYSSTAMTTAGYSSMNDDGYGNTTGGYTSTVPGGYTANNGGYGTEYGDNRGSGGYGAQAAVGTTPAYGTANPAGGYSSATATGGYGDSYNSGRVTGQYETVYPLPQTRSRLPQRTPKDRRVLKFLA